MHKKINPKNLISLNINFSFSEVTEGALQIWRALPERIRQDPSLATFRQENERLHGGKCANTRKKEQKTQSQSKQPTNIALQCVYLEIKYISS